VAIRIETLRLDGQDRYERYLLRRPDSLFYSSSKYKNFLKSLLACEEEYLLAVDGREVCGILPLLYMYAGTRRLYNSLPYYGSNGGVLADSPEASQALIGAYNEIAHAQSTLGATIVSNPFADQDHKGVVHNFTDTRIAQFTCLSQANDARTDLLQRLESSARRNIRKAVTEGVTVEKDAAQIDWLRRTHQDNMRSIGGIPKSDAFFQEVPRNFSIGDDYDIYTAKLGSETVAALLLFYYNRTVEYFTPAISSEHRSIQPLSAIVMEAMVDAAERGFRWWNWGGTWVTQDGVYRFKRKWGAQERRYTYFTQLNDQDMLNWLPNTIVSSFPGFFVAPFSVLRNSGITDE
jgi:hypothetical protein